MKTKDDKIIRDLVVTTTYILTQIMDNPSFISYVDKAMDIATAFVKIYPHNTNWEDRLNWEDTLYDFYKNYK